MLYTTTFPRYFFALFQREAYQHAVKQPAKWGRKILLRLALTTAFISSSLIYWAFKNAYQSITPKSIATFVDAFPSFTYQNDTLHITPDSWLLQDDQGTLIATYIQNLTPSKASTLLKKHPKALLLGSKNWTSRLLHTLRHQHIDSEHIRLFPISTLAHAFSGIFPEAFKHAPKGSFRADQIHYDKTKQQSVFTLHITHMLKLIWDYHLLGFTLTFVYQFFCHMFFFLSCALGIGALLKTFPPLRHMILGPNLKASFSILIYAQILPAGFILLLESLPFQTSPSIQNILYYPLIALHIAVALYLLKRLGEENPEPDKLLKR